MSASRYMLSIEVAGNKRYCMKLKTRISNHKDFHKQLQNEMELFCERNGFEEMSEGYADFCGGIDKINENWSKQFEDSYPEYRTEEDEKQRQKEIKGKEMIVTWREEDILDDEDDDLVVITY